MIIAAQLTKPNTEAASNIPRVNCRKGLSLNKARPRNIPLIRKNRAEATAPITQDCVIERLMAITSTVMYTVAMDPSIRCLDTSLSVLTTRSEVRKYYYRQKFKLVPEKRLWQLAKSIDLDLKGLTLLNE